VCEHHREDCIAAAGVKQYKTVPVRMEQEEDVGLTFSLPTEVVRIVLAGVWIACGLGCVLEQISDLLAFVIDLDLIGFHKETRDCDSDGCYLGLASV
jgi:hypothetical protein